MLQQENTRITQKEIAKKVGVSPATVSMVMRGRGNISEEIRIKIINIAKQAGYQLPTVPSSQHDQEPVYVMVLEYEHFEYQWNFVKPFVLNLTRELYGFNCYPIFFHVDKDIDETLIENAVKASNSRAVCSIHYCNCDFFNRLKRQGIPVVLLNNNIFQKDFSAVCVDDYQGVYNGVGYLVEHGHRNILYVDYQRPDFEACVTDRYNGFRKAADEFKIDYNRGNRVTLELEDKDELTKKFHKTMEDHSDATAILFHDDYLASWAIPELQRMGFHIPEDISVIAPGDTLDFNEPFTPKFSTIKIDTSTMGKLGGQLIKELIDNPNSEIRRLQVTPTIVDRGSCKNILQSV